MNKDTLFRWLGRTLIPNIGTILIVALMLAYQQATAQSGATNPNSPLVTSTFAYQGFLTNATGQPINGNRALTFRLYGVPTGGTALWTEVRNIVSIQSGLFDVRLGEIVPIPSSVWDNTNLYLGVQVEGESELLPREAIGLVPVAQRSITADTAIHADLALTVPDGSITSEKLNPTIESILLSETVTLTEQRQTLLTTTIEVDYPAQVLIIPSLNFVVGNGATVGELFVDNQLQSGELTAWLLGPGDSVRTVVSNSYIINLTPGIHTISVTGRISPGTVTGYVYGLHSGMTYLIFSQ